MNKRVLSLVCIAAAVVVFALAAYVTATNLIEAYGSGPPYYGMTTNMDKWESPVGFLLGINLAALALIGVLGFAARQSWR